MRITTRHLRYLIRESINGPWTEVAAEHLKKGDSVSAMEEVLNHYMMDDTWRMEEDALEDLLIDLGPNPTAKDVEATSGAWLADYRAGKYRPKSPEEEKADWARGNKPRQR